MLLLDEPLSSIDEENRRDLQEELKRIHHETGITALHVTHDHSEAYSISDRMAVIRGGSIVQTGTPEEIYRNPVDEVTASFLGFENILRTSPSTEPNEVEINGIHLVLSGHRSGNRCTVCIRGEEISLSSRPPNSGVNIKLGRIIDTRAVGSTIEVRIDIGFELKITLSRREYLALGRRDNDEVFVTIPTEVIRVFEGNPRAMDLQ
jgi:ABC-type Fe3+/spermidine/putrescine transport system ATPase subunit